MTLSAEKEYAHLGETAGAADHDHDLVKELTKRLDALWHYDQYVANADGKPELQAFWAELKNSEQATVNRLKTFIRQEIARDCF